MNIYLLTRKRDKINHDWIDYNQYIGCVTVAESEEDAMNIMPNNEPFKEKTYEWVNKDLINIKLIGTANVDQKRGVILDSFNQG